MMALKIFARSVGVGVAVIFVVYLATYGLLGERFIKESEVSEVFSPMLLWGVLGWSLGYAYRELKETRRNA